MKPLPELPPKLQALLDRQRARGLRATMPTATRERLLASLQATGAMAPVAITSASSLSRSGTLSKLAAGKASIALVSFALGSGSGAAVHAALTRRTITAPPPRAVAAPVPMPPRAVPPPTLAREPEPKSPMKSHRQPPRETEPAPVAAPGRGDAALAAERRLLDIARTALTRGDAQGALSAIANHAHDFPQGELAEDRDVLRVQALLGVGRREEALAAARAFETKYPGSFALPALKESLGNSP
jgi:hypothetical protein